MTDDRYSNFVAGIAYTRTFELLDRIDQGKTTHEDAMLVARLICGSQVITVSTAALKWLNDQLYVAKEKE